MDVIGYEDGPILRAMGPRDHQRKQKPCASHHDWESFFLAPREIDENSDKHWDVVTISVFNLNSTKVRYAWWMHMGTWGLQGLGVPRLTTFGVPRFGGFLKLGYPPIIHFDGIFPIINIINHLYRGSPILGKPHMMIELLPIQPVCVWLSAPGSC